MRKTSGGILGTDNTAIINSGKLTEIISIINTGEDIEGTAIINTDEAIGKQGTLLVADSLYSFLEYLKNAQFPWHVSSDKPFDIEFLDYFTLSTMALNASG